MNARSRLFGWRETAEIAVPGAANPAPVISNVFQLGAPSNHAPVQMPPSLPTKKMSRDPGVREVADTCAFTGTIELLAGATIVLTTHEDVDAVQAALLSPPLASAQKTSRLYGVRATAANAVWRE